MKTETIKTIGIIILVILLIVSLLYFKVLPKYNEEIYTQGYKEAQLQLIQYQTQTGNIKVINNNTIQELNINDICNYIK